MSPIFNIGFFKRVADSYGYPFDAEQGLIEFSSREQLTDADLEEAKQRFAALCGVADWHHRADYVQVSQAACPDRQLAKHKERRPRRMGQTRIHRMPPPYVR